MDLKLKRNDFQSFGVFSQFMSLDESCIVSVTIEHAFPQSDGSFKPAIPPGVYTCRRRTSPHFGFEVFEIMNVPGHDYIEIHPGNTNEDTKGCVCPGQYRQGQMVLSSRLAFETLMKLEEGLDTWELTVE